MLTLQHMVAGEECTINFPDHPEDLPGFDHFLARGDEVLGFDTETTDLDIFPEHSKVRLVQFGNRTEAWVLQADKFAPTIQRALRQPRWYSAHNAPFDCLNVDTHLDVKLEELMPRVRDTRVAAHLLDPREPFAGGLGLKLKPLSAHYVDPKAPDTQGGLTAEFRRLGFTKETGWAKIPIDNPLYVLYAGLDTILQARLDPQIVSRVQEVGLNHLLDFEHQLQYALAILQRRGMKIDIAYAEQLRRDLRAEAKHWREEAAREGVSNVNSTAQVAGRLLAMGEELTERTPTGKLKVDSKVLMQLADVGREWEPLHSRKPNPLAEAVLRSKRAEKWATAYADNFLKLRDANDRLHPSIGGLQARTARMSVSRPALQQLPSAGWQIRRAFVADPGMSIIACDYQAVEMRVLAALADVRRMKEAIAAGEDLHAFTAALVEGTDLATFEARLKAGDKAAAKARKLLKGVGFGKVYGGGAATLSRQTGSPIDAVRAAIRAYDEVYPEIKRFSSDLMYQATVGIAEVVTPTGRRLPLDADRLYAATNYKVQSTARDLLAHAILKIFAAGLGQYLLLPVHDELIGQAPTEDAEEIIREIGRVMESDFMGVWIASDPTVYGASWGHGYGAPY